MQTDYITSLLSVLQGLPNSYRAELSFLPQALKSLHHLAAPSLSVSLSSPAFRPPYAELPAPAQPCGAPSALCACLCLEPFLTCFICLFFIFHNTAQGAAPLV